jgi:hypothetical protein
MTTMEAAAMAASAVKGGARGLSPEGERELIRRVVETVGDGAERHIDRLAWRIGLRNTAKMAPSVWRSASAASCWDTTKLRLGRPRRWKEVYLSLRLHL